MYLDPVAEGRYESYGHWLVRKEYRAPSRISSKMVHPIGIVHMGTGMIA